MPDTWKDEGVWFEDWGRAFKLAGVTPFRTVEEMLATYEQQQPYWDARAGIAPEPSVLMSSKDYAADWQQAFGFSGYQTDVAIGPGKTYSDSTRPAYIEGVFDAATIRQKLAALGYQERQAAGRTYYAIRDDFAATVNDPARFALAKMNRVYVQEGATVTAPATAQMEGILAAWAGGSPSLADAPAFASVATALGDPLSAAILPRAVALDVSNTRVLLSPSTPGTVPWPELQKQAGWGSLHEWETVGVGYTKSENGQRWYTFALYYPDKSAAADAAELKRRMESYESAAPEEMLERGWSARPLEICGPLAVEVAEVAGGSTLAVWCPLAEDVTIGWGRSYNTSTGETSWAGVNAWFMYLDMKDIAFLVP